MAKKITFEQWKARIELAGKAQKDSIQDGEEFRKMYEGKLPDVVEVSFPDQYILGVNFVYVDMKQSVPNLYAKDPKFFFQPNIPQAELPAQLMEHVINDKWCELNMKSVMRKGIQAAKLDGVCAFKTFFYFKKDEIQNDWSNTQKNDEVCTQLVPLKDLLKDPDAPSYAKSQWIGHKVTELVDDIADRFGFRSEKAEQITVTSATEKSDYLRDEVKGDFQYGTYYEIEDRKNRKIIYIVEGIDGIVETKPLEEVTSKYDSMYDFLAYNEIEGRCDPKSDYHFWKSHVAEVAIFRTMRFQKALKAATKYKVLGKRLEDYQRDQLKNSVESSYIEMEAGQDVQPMQSSMLDPTVFQSEQSARADIQLISKQAPRQSGGEKTATEVKAVEAAQMEVTTDARDLLDAVMESIVYKWICLMEKNYDANRFVALSGMSNADFMMMKSTFGKMGEEVMQGSSEQPFIQYNKNYLSNKVRVKIKAGSSAPDNDATRMQKLQGFVGAVKSLGYEQALDPKEVIDELVEVFGVENDNLLATKDSPVEESRILQSGVFIAPRMTDDHKMHIQQHLENSKNTPEEHFHIMVHRLYDEQQTRLQQAQAPNGDMGQMMPPQMSGQSFGQDPQAVGLPGQVGPQGMPAMGNSAPMPQMPPNPMG
jgi:hypothetical protein